MNTSARKRYRYRSVLRFEQLGERITPSAGDLDPFFGTGGRAGTGFGLNPVEGRCMDIDSLGRIVVAGSVIVSGGVSDIAIARFNSNGSLDASFGTGGTVKATYNLGSSERIFAVAIDSSNRIVVAGGVADFAAVPKNDFALIRFNVDGSLDTTFGTGGRVRTSIGSEDDYLYAIVIDDDGKIVVAGSSSVADSRDFVVARYNDNGTLDNSFAAGNGYVRTSLGSSDDVGLGVALDANKNVIVAGYSTANGASDIAIARYTPSGSIDPSFGALGTGYIKSDFGSSNDRANSVVIDGAGKILVAGESGGMFALGRFLSSGAADITFSIDGKVTTPVASSSSAADVVIDESGRIVAAGWTFVEGRNVFAVARYDADGYVDPGFGSHGLVLTDYSNGAIDGSNSALSFAAEIDASGRIVVAGTLSFSHSGIALARYLSDEFRINSGTPATIYTEDSGPLTIDPALTLIESPKLQLANATIRIGNYVRIEDRLHYVVQGGIAANFDPVSGILTLSNSAALGDYEDVLRSVAYSNLSQSPSILERTISISLEGSAEITYPIRIIARNDAPTLIDDALLPSILQGTAAPVGQKIATLFRGLNIDPDAGALLSGVAVVGNAADAASQGTWQYSTNNGIGWHDIATVADGPQALALSAATRIRFSPTAAFIGVPTPLVLRALDDTFGSSFTDGANRIVTDTTLRGGTTSIAANTNQIETNVVPIGGSGNTPPSLFGVPVSVNINEGETLTFTASATDTDVGQTLGFILDGAPPTSSIDPDTGAFSWQTTEADGPKTFIFNVQVSDGLAITERPVTVFVHEVNVAPTIADVPGGIKVVRGHTMTFTATSTDLDVLNGFGNALTFSADGSPPGINVGLTTGTVTVLLPEDMRTGESISATIRVTDDGVPQRSDAKTIVVTALAAAIVNGDLLIGGTNRNDAITVVPTRDASQFVVMMNGAAVGRFPSADITGRIVARGLSGNDRISISPRITKSADLHGDAGHDVLVGGGGDDRLFGNAGNDRLIGGRGNDLSVGGDGNDFVTDAIGTNVLLGGNGSDRLIGGNGDDLLIAGPTIFDNVLPLLGDIFAEWISGSSYDDRVSHLKGPIGGENGATFLTQTTVQDDFDRDVLFGGRGSDIFVVSALDLFDLRTGEQKLDV